MTGCCSLWENEIKKQDSKSFDFILRTQIKQITERQFKKLLLDGHKSLRVLVFTAPTRQTISDKPVSLVFVF